MRIEKKHLTDSSKDYIVPCFTNIEDSELAHMICNDLNAENENIEYYYTVVA